MPLYMQALLWGLLAGSALVIGAGLASVPRIPQRLIAAVMAFGAGVLISALSFELIDVAHKRGGLASTAIGFLLGAAAFTAANVWITRSGGHHRKRSAGDMQRHAHGGGGLAIAVGALFDGIPESVTIGVGLLADRNIGLVAVAAVFFVEPARGTFERHRHAQGRPLERLYFRGLGASRSRAASRP